MEFALAAGIAIFFAFRTRTGGGSPPGSGYKVACLQQGSGGDVQINESVGYHLALSDRHSNRCFYKFNNAYDGRIDSTPPANPYAYDVLIVRFRSPLHRDLSKKGFLGGVGFKNKAGMWYSLTPPNSPYAHLFTPTKSQRYRHVLTTPSGTLYDKWNDVCTALGGKNCN